MEGGRVICRSLAWCLLLPALLWLACEKQPVDDPGDRLESLVARYVERQRAAASPEEAPDLSAAGFLQEIEEEKQLLAALRGIDPNRLSLPQRVDWMLLEGRLESSVFSAERRRPWENDPTIYIASDRISRALRQGAEGEERTSSITTLLDAVPGMLQEGRRNLKHPPKRFTEAAIFQARAMTETLKTRVLEVAAAAGSDRTDLLEANQRAIEALVDFEAFLTDDILERSTGTWAIGAEEYDHFLKRRWFLDYDADTVLEKGRQVFEETEAEAQEVANRIEPGKHWVEVYERLKNDHPAADEIKNAYQEQMDAAQAFLIENEVVTLPAGESVITLDTPPALRRSSPFGTFGSVDPFGTDLQGRLILTPIEDWMTPEQRRERLRSHHRSWIPLIAVHEAYPGHHVHALKMRENPRLLRRVIRESIFSEGWGLFTEEMMFELGFLKGDDVRLTQLRNRLWRAARVIIDSSLHTGKMEIEEAVDFLVEKVRFERYAAELEVDMYPRNPVYVLGYLIGLLELRELRDAYYQKYGEPEKPKEFYDKLLSSGSMPPALVRVELLGESAMPE